MLEALTDLEVFVGVADWLWLGLRERDAMGCH
jgi:hypothetical protein